MQVSEPLASLRYTLAREIKIAEVVKHARAKLERTPHFIAQSFDAYRALFDCLCVRDDRPESFCASLFIFFVNVAGCDAVNHVVDYLYSIILFRPDILQLRLFNSQLIRLRSHFIKSLFDCVLF